MRTIKNILLVLSTGYILVYFSEHLFWARTRPDDSLGNWISAWIAYSLMAYIFLNLVSHFRVENIWSLFLAGAAFGWIDEGIVVQTAYDMLPLSISFTGLAWHALITIWIGWYAAQKSFLSKDNWLTVKLAGGIGIFYGFWAISWWLEPDGGVSSVTEFAMYSFITTLLVILAFWLGNWSLSETFAPNRWVNAFVFAAFALYFVFVTVPAAPIAMMILPILLGLVYLGLRQNQCHPCESSLLEKLKGHVPVWKYTGLLALPIASTLIYTFAMSFNVQLHTHWVLYLVTTPLGFILFVISLYKQPWRKPNP